MAPRRPAAHDRWASRQPPRRVPALELAAFKRQGIGLCKQWTLTHGRSGLSLGLFPRLWPSTSAAKIATSLRSVSPVLIKTHPRTASDRLPRARQREYPEVEVLRLVFRKMTISASGQTGISGHPSQVCSFPNNRHEATPAARQFSHERTWSSLDHRVKVTGDAR
jgi:hypothetical protein